MNIINGIDVYCQNEEDNEVLSVLKCYKWITPEPKEIARIPPTVLKDHYEVIQKHAVSFAKGQNADLVYIDLSSKTLELYNWQPVC